MIITQKIRDAVERVGCKYKIQKKKDELNKQFDKLNEAYKNQEKYNVNLEKIPLNKEYLITAEQNKTTIKVDDTEKTFDKNIGSITKDDLITNFITIKGGNSTPQDTAKKLEISGCDKELKKLDEQFEINKREHNERLKRLKTKQTKIEDIQQLPVNIPNNKLTIKATNDKTEITYYNNTTKGIEKNIGMIDLNNIDNNQNNQSGNTVVNPHKSRFWNLIKSVVGGNYTKKTFRYPTKRNKLGRFVKGKTRKSNK